MPWYKSLGIHKSWFEFFIDNIDTISNVNRYLNQCTEKNITFYPQKSKIFNCFSHNKADTRVIFIKDCPYTFPNMATGDAFAVPNKRLCSSELNVIKDELCRYQFNFFIDGYFDYTLKKWKDQGILLLNSALTVKAGTPNSHNYIWEDFFIGILRLLNTELAGLIFVFVGKNVQRYSELINPTVHHIIKTEDPKKDSYRNTNHFIGNNVFKEIDDTLFKMNGEKIVWV